MLLSKVIINEYVVFIQHIHNKSNIKAGLNWDCVLVRQLIRLIWLCLVLLKYAETACYSTWLYSYQYLFSTSVIFYLVSWHLCTWVHSLARCEIHTNNYILLQFIQETNTRGSKTLTPLTPFHTNLQCFDY